MEHWDSLKSREKIITRGESKVESETECVYLFSVRLETTVMIVCLHVGFVHKTTLKKIFAQN